MLPEWLRQWAIRTHHLPESSSDAEILTALRQLGGPDMAYRQAPIASPDGQRQGPATWNEDTRSVEAVIASEAPVPMFDWERGEMVDEVLLMSGVELPPSRQVPLLNSHNRWDGVGSQLGSTRDIRADDDQLVAANHFADTQLGRDGAALVRDGHCTDFSVGYQVYRDSSVFVPKGETQKIGSRSFTATKERGLLVRTKWRLRENSLTPIGADPAAKARAAGSPLPSTTTTSNTRKPHPMNPELRALLSRQFGLDKDATDEQAWACFREHQAEVAQLLARAQEPTPPNPATPNPPQENARQDHDDIREALAEIREFQRCEQIRAIANQFDIPDEVRDEQIVGKVPVEQAQAAFARHVLARGAQQPSPRFAVDVLADETDKLRAAGVDAILMRGGIQIEKPAPGATELAGLTLREFARECLIRSNVRPPANLREMIVRALSTSDFQYVLANSATKSLAEGYDAEPAGWRDWAAIGGGISDFKTHTENRVYEVSAFAQVLEGEEYQYGTRSEKPPESFQMAKYGQLFAITEETIRNDDLGALTDIPRQHGEEAARLVADTVYAVLTANGALGDTIALFHADHNNLVDTDAGAAPGTATFDAAELAMSTQKDGGGRKRLMIEPVFFVGPRALKGAAEVFFNTDRFVDSDTDATRINRWFRRVKADYNSRLDDDSTTAWYLLGPKGKTVVVRFLDGRQAPELWSKDGWKVDGIEYKARIGVVSYARDYRAMYKNVGYTAEG